MLLRAHPLHRTGLHALDGNITNVDVFYDAGVRMMGLAHFFDNDISGELKP